MRAFLSVRNAPICFSSMRKPAARSSGLAVNVRGFAGFSHDGTEQFSRAVIRVARQYTMSTVKLFSQERAHQHVRPCKCAEIQDCIGAIADRIIQAVSAADKKHYRAGTIVAPAAKAHCKFFTCFVLALFIQGDNTSLIRNCGHQRRSLAGTALVGIEFFFYLISFNSMRQGRRAVSDWNRLRSGPVLARPTAATIIFMAKHA